MPKEFGNSDGKWEWSISTERYHSFKYPKNLNGKPKAEAEILVKTSPETQDRKMHVSPYSEVIAFYMALSSARGNFQTNCAQLHICDREQRPCYSRLQQIPGAVHPTYVF